MDFHIPSDAEVKRLSEQDYRVLENRVRRVGQRRGIKLEKSRARDPRAAEYGTYHLVDMATGGIVCKGFDGGYGMSLADAAKALMATPITLLADELARRGYTVAIGKNFGGQTAQILEDAQRRPVGVTIVDFGRDPVGRTVDIRWESHGDSHFCEGAIDTDQLADRVIRTL